MYTPAENIWYDVSLFKKEKQFNPLKKKKHLYNNIIYIIFLPPRKHTM
jgi:hypothetical protein